MGARRPRLLARRVALAVAAALVLHFALALLVGGGGANGSGGSMLSLLPEAALWRLLSSGESRGRGARRAGQPPVAAFAGLQGSGDRFRVSDGCMEAASGRLNVAGRRAWAQDASLGTQYKQR